MIKGGVVDGEETDSLVDVDDNEVDEVVSEEGAEAVALSVVESEAVLVDDSASDEVVVACVVVEDTVGPEDVIDDEVDSDSAVLLDD